MFKKPNKETIKKLKISAKSTKKEMHKISLKAAMICATPMLGFLLYVEYVDYVEYAQHVEWSLIFFIPFCIGLLVYFFVYFLSLFGRWTSKKQLAFLSRAEDSKDVNDFFKSKEIKNKEAVQKVTGKKVKDLEDDLFK
jgi:hypothetical protein